MNEKWQSLNQREQYLVIAMSAVIGIFILYSFIWQPANNSIIEKEAKIIRHQTLLTWMNEKKSIYGEQSKQGSSKQSGGSLSSIVNRSATSNAITIARIQPKGDDVVVSIDEVPFEVFMHWLKNMTNSNVVVKSLDISDVANNGVVKVRRLTLGKT